MSSKKNKASSQPTSDATSTVTEDKKAVPVAGNTAKKQMCSIFAEPAPPAIRHVRGGKGGGDATSLCKVQGVVTRTKEEVVNGPKGAIPKKRIDIIVTAVIPNGAQDVVRTGIEGEAYLFPSRQIDTPETAEGGDKNGFKGKSRELICEPNQVVRKLSTLSCSFYKEGKEGGDTGVMACEAGMTVEISGVCVNAVTKGGGTNFYLNGGKLTCLMDKAPTPGELANHMISLAKTPKMLEWSAFASSIPMKGFFDTTEMNPAQKVQAAACQSLWAKLVQSAADRVGTMAQGKEADVAAQLEAHESRIRQTPPEKIASGDMNLFLIDKYDSTLAPLVQAGLAPWSKGTAPELIQNLQGTPEEQARLPPMFTAPWVVNLETQGKGLTIDMRVAYIFDKDAALEAFDAGDHNPMLSTATAGIAMALSMRDFAVKFGSLMEDKVRMACINLLPTADFAAFPKISTIEEGGEGALKTDFPEGGTLFVDVPKTLDTHGILVSEEFIKTNLCGGGSQFVPPKAKADVAKFDFPEKVTDMPDLEAFKYQEITFDAFDITNWADIAQIEYRVVCPGVAEHLCKDRELCTNAAKGEAFLKGIHAGLDQPNKMKLFLTSECLVYAVIA